MKNLGDMVARMEQRKQRNREEQEQLARKQNMYSNNPDALNDISELESTQQAPKPKRRHHRSSTKSPFDDDSSLQFSYTEKHSNSTVTTSSSTPHLPNKFVKKPVPMPIPSTTEKLTVTRSPRDVSSPRVPKVQSPPRRKNELQSSTGFVSQSTILARAAHRIQLSKEGRELEPGAFDEENSDESSSDGTTSGSKNIFNTKRKSFLKKTATQNQVPDLEHLESETIDREPSGKKLKDKKNERPSSVIDTDDDSCLDSTVDRSSSDGRKTPISTPRKSILKTSKKQTSNEIEYSRQQSDRYFSADDERAGSPIKSARAVTPRRVQIVDNPVIEEDIPSEVESISTAISVTDAREAEDNTEEIISDNNLLESPADNMLANLIMNDEPLIASTPRRQSPRSKIKPPSSKSKKKHSKSHTISNVSEDDAMKVMEVQDETNIIDYSEDFSSGPTENSTPRSPIPTSARKQKDPQQARKISTDNQQVQVDLTSSPFQSSLNHVHSIYLINQNDLNQARPSSVIRSVVDSNVLQSILTTNPVILAVDDLIREQSSLLRSFIQLQRTYYESTIRSIEPNHIYVTKDNTLRFIANQQRSRMQFETNDDTFTK